MVEQATATGDDLTGPERDQAEFLDYIADKSADVYVTFISIMIGMAFADVLFEARERMHLWPLDAAALLTWGQLIGTCVSTLGVWAVFAQLGVSRRGVPGMTELFAASVPPIYLLFVHGLVGAGAAWPWFYAAGVFLLIGEAAFLTTLHVMIRRDGAMQFQRMMRPWGFLAVLHVSAPFCLLLGLLGQMGWLPGTLAILLTFGVVPAAMLFAFLFFRDWRNCLADAASLAAPEGPAAPPMSLTEVVKSKAPDLFVTLASIMVGMVMSDLVSEVRERMVIWPITPEVLITWGQIAFQMTAALASWSIYAHCAMTRRQTPFYGETLSALYAPVLLLVINSFVGSGAHLAWMASMMAFGLGSLMTNLVTLRMAEPAVRARFRGVMAPLGYMTPVYLGLLTFVVAIPLQLLGWLPVSILAVIVMSMPVAGLAHTAWFIAVWRARVLAPATTA